MRIHFLGSSQFNLLEFLLKLGIPRDSWVIQNHHFQKNETNPINPLFNADSFMNQFFEGQEWEKLALTIQTWTIYYKDSVLSLGTINEFKEIGTEVFRVCGFPHVIEEFEQEIQSFCEVLTEDIGYLVQSVDPGVLNDQLLLLFWSQFCKGLFSSAKNSPNFQKLFQENNCFPLDYSKKTGIYPMRDRYKVCDNCDKVTIEDLTKKHEGSILCISCHTKSFFQSLSASRRTFITHTISKYRGRCEEGFNDEKGEVSLFPTLNTWNITTPDFQRWATNNLMYWRWNHWGEGRVKRELQDNIEEYATVLKDIRAESPEDIAAFLTQNYELWINLSSHIFLRIAPHPSSNINDTQVTNCKREDFFRGLVEEEILLSYSRFKLSNEDLFFLAFLTIYRIIPTDLPFEAWFLSPSLFGGTGRIRKFLKTSDIWIANSKALSTNFLENDGFIIVTPQELILDTWDTLIVKGDDTKTPFPFEKLVEDSMKLLYTSDFLPLIFFKPDNPLIFKPGRSSIFICIDPKFTRPNSSFKSLEEVSLFRETNWETTQSLFREFRKTLFE